MARRKKTTQTTEDTTPGTNWFSNFKLNESYTSLILGLIVVIVGAVLIFSFARGRGGEEINNGEQTQTPQNLEEIEEGDLPTAYTVKEGDTLWDISEGVYNSGYNWVDIASENELENPDFIASGTRITLPKVEAKAPTVTEAPEAERITGNTYTVSEGDTLWDISVRAYGDGYRWPEVAEANNLTNPDLILIDSVLQLPR